MKNLINFQFPISNFQFPISNFQFPISNFQFLVYLFLLLSSLSLYSQDPRKKANLTLIFIESGTNQPVSSANVLIYKGDSLLVSTNSYSNSQQSFNIHPGMYNIKIKKEGFEEKRIDRFTVRDSALGYFRINLVRIKQN